MRPTPREQVLQLLMAVPAGLSAPDLQRLIRPRLSQPTLWRGLRMHQCAARRLAVDPDLRGLVRERLRKLREVNPHGRVYHDRWEALLASPLPALLRAMTEASEQADALRQKSPCTVLVTPEERRRVFESVRVT